MVIPVRMTSAVAAATLCLLVTIPAPAPADGERAYRDRSHAVIHGERRYGRDRRAHRYRAGHGRRGHHYHSRHGGNDEDVLIGMLLGGLIGYAIGNAEPAPPRVHAPVAHPHGHFPRAGAGYRSTGCLQEREYQATVVIGGEVREAYGTACLQPDGSWRRGPARPVPDY